VIDSKVMNAKVVNPNLMNIDPAPDHKICGSSGSVSAPLSDGISVVRRRSEGGYTLVALLAMMTVVALFAMAVAPSVQQQSQRELEKEAIFRGEQVADAIRDYYKYRSTISRGAGDQALPSSMDQLLEGIPIPGGSKNRQILRASAARDPLTIEGEWRFVLPRTDALIDFQQSVMFYAGNMMPTTQDPQMAQLQQFAVPQITSITNLGLASSTRTTSSIADDATGPFVGVASRSRRNSVLTYYGIERHDQWIFTPLFR
jgi:type II secretory pathway pseudopilin PulG